MGSKAPSIELFMIDCAGTAALPVQTQFGCRGFRCGGPGISVVRQSCRPTSNLNGTFHTMARLNGTRFVLDSVRRSLSAASLFELTSHSLRIPAGRSGPRRNVMKSISKSPVDAMLIAGSPRVVNGLQELSTTSTQRSSADESSLTASLWMRVWGISLVGRRKWLSRRRK